MRDGAGSVGFAGSGGGGAGLSLAMIASRWKYKFPTPTIRLPIPSTAPRERLLLLLLLLSLALASGLVGAGSAAFASVSLARASLARRLRSASLLPLATRPGFLAGLVFGGSAVTLAGAGAGVGASGIVSSGCEVMVSILMCQISFRFLSDSCQVSHTSSSPSSG